MMQAQLEHRPMLSQQRNRARLTLPDIGPLWLHAILIILGVLTLMPFVWMIATSLKTAGEVLSATPVFWPKEAQWQNYSEVFSQVPFARFYFNTIVVTLARTIGQVFFAAVGGYAFARIRFPARNILFIAILVVLMVPGQVTLIPNFVLLKSFGWLDSYQGLIVPSLFSAFGVFLLRQFFMTLPQELEDAAVIDGCNPFQVFWHVALPLSRSVLVAFGVLVTLWSWNDFLWPLIITSSTNMQMLSVGMAFFQTQANVTNYAVMMAAATLATIPMIIIFVFAQRYLIEGITMSGLKL